MYGGYIHEGHICLRGHIHTEGQILMGDIHEDKYTHGDKYHVGYTQGQGAYTHGRYTYTGTHTHGDACTHAQGRTHTRGGMHGEIHTGMHRNKYNGGTETYGGLIHGHIHMGGQIFTQGNICMGGKIFTEPYMRTNTHGGIQAWGYMHGGDACKGDT